MIDPLFSEREYAGIHRQTIVVRFPLQYFGFFFGSHYFIITRANPNHREEKSIYRLTFINVRLPRSTKKKPGVCFKYCRRFEAALLKTLVVLQLLHVAEAGAAVGALERGLLVAVDQLVSLQVLHAAEPLPASLAPVRPLSRVDALVALQVAQATEGAAALGAPVWPLARVDQVMAL